jgi:protoheme IX farnesyltransferase
VAVTAVDPRQDEPVEAGFGGSGSAVGLSQRLKGYLALTKPRIIELLLVTTVPTMFLAAGGLPDLWIVIATLIGGSLAAGGANTFNCVIDRDIDAVMHRTADRPLATGLIAPAQATIFGTVLTVASVVWLSATVNVLSAALAAFAIAFYVLGYTVLLKRRTSQNIVWGGAAGCMPVLIGWSAVTGSLSWTPIVLFMVIFFWTPPHYWPLSLRYRDDYVAANVPMLPAVADQQVVAKSIVIYSYLMVATTLILWPVANMSWVYVGTATVLGGLFLYEAHRILSAARKGLDESIVRPMRLFQGSITYLTLIFVAIAIDPFVP